VRPYDYRDAYANYLANYSRPGDVLVSPLEYRAVCIAYNRYQIRRTVLTGRPWVTPIGVFGCKRMEVTDASRLHEDTTWKVGDVYMFLTRRPRFEKRRLFGLYKMRMSRTLSRYVRRLDASGRAVETVFYKLKPRTGPTEFSVLSEF